MQRPGRPGPSTERRGFSRTTSSHCPDRIGKPNYENNIVFSDRGFSTGRFDSSRRITFLLIFVSAGLMLGQPCAGGDLHIALQNAAGDRTGIIVAEVPAKPGWLDRLKDRSGRRTGNSIVTIL